MNYQETAKEIVLNYANKHIENRQCTDYIRRCLYCLVL